MRAAAALASLVVAVIVYGCGADRLPLDKRAEYAFAPAARCIDAAREFASGKHPDFGSPIRGLSVIDSNEGVVVGSLYFAPTSADARFLSSEEPIADEDPEVYGNVVVSWEKRTDESESVVTDCLRRAVR